MVAEDLQHKMSDKYRAAAAIADVEAPLLKPRPQEETPCCGEADRTFYFRIGIHFLFLTIIVWHLLFFLNAMSPLDVVCVDTLNASSNGTTWDTDIFINFPARYPYEGTVDVKYDNARASLILSGGEGGVSSFVPATMRYRRDWFNYQRDWIELHADFPRSSWDQEGVVPAELWVEANVTVVVDHGGGEEMRSYMTIECSDFGIQFLGDKGRLWLHHDLVGSVRTLRNGRWYKGIKYQKLEEYLHPSAFE